MKRAANYRLKSAGIYPPALLAMGLFWPAMGTASCPAERVAEARARWEAAAVRDFRFTIRAVEFVVVRGAHLPVSVRVPDGKIASVSYAASDGARYRIGARVPRRLWTHLVLSPEQFFDRMDQAASLAASDREFDVRCAFDDETGFPWRLETDSATMSDSYSLLEITDFRVIE